MQSGHARALNYYILLTLQFVGIQRFQNGETEKFMEEVKSEDKIRKKVKIKSEKKDKLSYFPIAISDD